MELDYPILSDPEKKAAKAFGVLNARGMANRVTIYVDDQGKIAKIENVSKAGEDGANAVKNMLDLKFSEKESSELKKN